MSQTLSFFLISATRNVLLRARGFSGATFSMTFPTPRIFKVNKLFIYRFSLFFL